MVCVGAQVEKRRGKMPLAWDPLGTTRILGIPWGGVPNMAPLRVATAEAADVLAAFTKCGCMRREQVHHSSSVMIHHSRGRGFDHSRGRGLDGLITDIP